LIVIKRRRFRRSNALTPSYAAVAIVLPRPTINRSSACTDANKPRAVGFGGLWTGQRQGDLLRLPWSAYDGTHIRLRQSKTGRRVEIKAGAPLKAALDDGSSHRCRTIYLRSPQSLSKGAVVLSAFNPGTG
jgi:hypothetical protein